MPSAIFLLAKKYQQKIPGLQKILIYPLQSSDQQIIEYVETLKSKTVKGKFLFFKNENRKTTLANCDDFLTQVTSIKTQPTANFFLLAELPPELQVYILSFLIWPDLIRFAMVNKYCNNTIRELLPTMPPDYSLPPLNKKSWKFPYSVHQSSILLLSATQLAVASKNKLDIFSIQTGKILQSFRTNSEISCLTLSADKKVLISVTKWGVLDIWQLADWQHQRVVLGIKTKFLAVRSNDIFAIINKFNVMYLWDLKTLDTKNPQPIKEIFLPFDFAYRGNRVIQNKPYSVSFVETLTPQSFVVACDQHILFISGEKWETLHQYTLESAVTYCKILSEKEILVITENGELSEWEFDLSKKEPLQLKWQKNIGFSVESITIAYDNLIGTTAAGDLIQLNLADSQTTPELLPNSAGRGKFLQFISPTDFICISTSGEVITYSFPLKLVNISQESSELIKKTEESKLENDEELANYPFMA